jgi:hypothetical protein
MKIYIGDKDINDESYKKITEIQILNFVAEDSECTSIVLDNILRKFQLNELVGAMQLVAKKTRLGGTISIVDIDFDLLCYVYRKNSDIVSLNQAVANAGGFKSLLTNSLILELLKNFPGFKLVSAQANNIEFRVEIQRVS